MSDTWHASLYTPPRIHPLPRPGDRHGLWEVLSGAGYDARYALLLRVLCHGCGTEYERAWDSLRRGQSRGCVRCARPPRRPSRAERMARRQEQVARLRAEGLTRPVIAARLGCSEATVGRYLRRRREGTL